MMNTSTNSGLPEDAMLPSNMSVAATLSCFVCDMEFSTEELLAPHLILHTEEAYWKNEIKKVEKQEAEQRELLMQRYVKAPPEIITIDDDSDECSPPAPKVVHIAHANNNLSSLNKGVRFQNSSSVGHTQNRNKGAVRKSSIPSMFSIAPTKSIVSAKQSMPKRNFSNVSVIQAPSMPNSKIKTENVDKEYFLPHACQICNARFAYKSTLRDHLQKHVGEKNHKCRICNMRFAVKGVLKQHEETHKNKDGDNSDYNWKPKDDDFNWKPEDDDFNMNKFFNLGLSIYKV